MVAVITAAAAVMEIKTKISTVAEAQAVVAAVAVATTATTLTAITTTTSTTITTTIKATGIKVRRRPVGATVPRAACAIATRTAQSRIVSTRIRREIGSRSSSAMISISNGNRLRINRMRNPRTISPLCLAALRRLPRAASFRLPPPRYLRNLDFLPSSNSSKPRAIAGRLARAATMCVATTRTAVGKTAGIRTRNATGNRSHSRSRHSCSPPAVDSLAAPISSNSSRSYLLATS